jgi:methylmalonyl-CoA/ethylmalonyl-CoA epimerase
MGKEMLQLKEPKIESVEEIAVAVKEVTETAALFKELFGFKFESEWERPNWKMRVRSESIAGVQFQLLESTSTDGVIAKFIESKGEGIHHIAFRVTNLEEMIAQLKQKGVKFIPEKPVEIPSSSYIFIHPKSARGVLIELIERR